MRTGTILSFLLFAAAAAHAQTAIRPRLLIVVDTSGSMIDHFTDNNGCGGDGDPASVFSDATQTGKNYYPGTSLGGGNFDGVNSRFYAARKALFEGVQATGDYEPGLMRFAPDLACPNAANCCNVATGACACASAFINNPGGSQCAPTTAGLITWLGGCGPVNGSGQATAGGQLLVQPGTAGYTSIMKWTDNVEDFRNDGSGAPVNPELRPAGFSVVAGSIRSAVTWYNTIMGGGTDPKINCRPYAVVLITDGSDTCEISPSNPATAPPAAVAQLYALNPLNPVKTYVIGAGILAADTANQTMLNSMAANGGTGHAVFATDRASTERALAAAIARSFKVETCDNADNNCNGVTDEGFPDKGLSCAVGVGACRNTGIRKCTASGLATQCCVNDAFTACTPLTAGSPVAEICGNGIDDNCDGRVDETPPCF